MNKDTGTREMSFMLSVSVIGHVFISGPSRMKGRSDMTHKAEIRFEFFFFGVLALDEILI